MFTHTATICFALTSAMACFSSSAVAQRIASDPLPELEGVEIIERLNERVPMDLEFINETGEVVRFGDFFEDGKPVILTLNYYTCPQLCHLTLNGLLDGLMGVEWTAGQEFQVVTISINPEEGPEQAMAFKNRYLRGYDREGADWHFLCDKDDNARKLADAVGYGYRYVPETGEYAHSSSIKFITPSGRISRYMNDVMFESRDLRFALVESSQGTIGSPMDRFLLLTCFSYDPNSNSYIPVAWKVMRTGGAITVIVVALALLILWWRGSAAEGSSNKHKRPDVQVANA